MEGWSTKRLCEVGRIVTGKTPPTAINANYGGDVPFVTPTDMDGRRTIDRTLRTLSQTGVRTIGSSYVPSSAVIVSCIGSDMGKAALVDRPFVSNQQINSIIVSPDYDRKFVYYNLAHRRDEIRFKASGAAQPIMNKSDFGNLMIDIPILGEQRAIAAVLSALDDKIELNRRMNETLEASARALFRDWFVDFGPTRAKAEGSPAYLAPDLWSLFPDRLNDDGVPRGWEWSTIGEEVEAVGGSTPSTKDAALWDGGIAWTTPKDLSDLGSPFLLDTARTITEAGLRTISSGLLPAGTVLMSSRAPVGYLAIASVPLAVNQGYIAMKCTGRVSNWNAYLWAHENMDAIISNANGSTFQEISKKNFRPLSILVADDATRSAFDRLVGPMFESITANVIESRTLAATRDALLPKLMSGEIRVRDAEALAA
ncbi:MULTISPECIES: restriction endonuclease subunit S [Sphingomonas]|jgi:type I restriction enzyme, S subunit|uniref:Restriction endonuclease subunit S n=1 Tax=Sphingomonas zeae TaxID=1646122 RepID=A0A7Y6EFW9_9SPHN|nr:MULTISPECIES: restriction endonuclease subunit S [Sphingomonas]MDK8187907.1 restriction endonuclease subunit S [Sphingomonas zeae]MDK8217714.1 restriction endonuclease subunit S [Sphingomonas sp. UMB7805-LC452B]NUU45801.1 restriction endonuclease subunit S [Sphingomonas zeae]